MAAESNPFWGISCKATFSYKESGFWSDGIYF
jgi:hypothetical protein